MVLRRVKKVLESCKGGVVYLVRRLSTSGSEVKFFEGKEDHFDELQKATEAKSEGHFIPMATYAWGANMFGADKDGDEVSVFSAETDFVPSSPKTPINFDGAFVSLDTEDEDKELSLFAMVHQGLTRQGSMDAADLIAEGLEDEVPAEEDKVGEHTLQARNSVVIDGPYLLESARAQLDKAKDPALELTVRKAGYEASLLLFKQAFIMGEFEAAQDLHVAYGGIRDKIGIDEEGFGIYTDFLIPYDNLKLNIWKQAGNVCKLFEEEGAEAMRAYVLDCRKVQICETNLGGLKAHENVLEKLRENFISKYEKDISWNNEEYGEMYAVATLGFMAKHLHPSSFTEWESYLENAVVGNGIELGVVNDFLKLTGEVSSEA